MYPVAKTINQQGAILIYYKHKGKDIYIFLTHP